MNNIHIKTVLLGDYNAGKTSLINRFIKDKFNDISETTIGCAYNSTTVNYNNKIYKIDIWDTAGQERFRSLMPMYYRNANIIYLCLDLTNPKLSDSFTKWIDIVNQHKDDDTNRYLCIVGTKSDIANEEILEIFKGIQEKYPEYSFYITSSKDNIGITDMFNISFNKAIENYITTNESTLLITIDNIKKSRCFSC